MPAPFPMRRSCSKSSLCLATATCFSTAARTASTMLAVIYEEVRVEQ